MIDKQQRKLRRMAAVAVILSRYGFNDVLARLDPRSGATQPGEDPTRASAPVYARIRMVLEELGPTFVKLGQALSNREDMLPEGLIRELQQLQDKVEAADIDITELLADNFGADYQEAFSTIDPQPLASASIAQVYRATLKTGEKVVLKVRRPHIEEVIEGDLLIMKDLARLLTTYFDFAEHINLVQAVNAFERSLLNELSLVNERENIERFARHFQHTPHSYVPKVYPALSNNQVLCMELVEGAKITDRDFLRQHGLDPAALANRGLQLYLSQLLEFGFFHADPHAGNIMVLPDGRIAFIDLGAMGVIYAADQELLEDVILNLVARNVPRLVALLKKMAIRIDIPDERKLQQDLSDMLAMVDAGGLGQLNIGLLIGKFKDVLFENRIVMPDYFTLLVRGLVLIESVGRTLDPKMNVLAGVEPYVARIVRKRMSPEYLFNKGVARLGELGHDLQHFPDDLRGILQRLNDGQLTIATDVKALDRTQAAIRRGFQLTALAVVLGSGIIATALLYAARPGADEWAWMGALGCVGLGGVLVLQLMKR